MSKHVCPGCGKPAAMDEGNRWRPFCSERCKMGDLGEWFAGRYSIPADDPSPADQPPEGPDRPRQ